MGSEVGVVDAAVIRFMFSKFGCVCEEDAAVMVIACFHHDFCTPVVVRTGFCVFPMNGESGEAVEGVLACWAAAVVDFLDNLRFLVLCYIGEFEFR